MTATANQEIRSFLLTFDGLMWVSHANGRFPIMMDLKDVAHMFDLEGLDMRRPNALDDCGCDAYRFTKVTLICYKARLHALRNEYGEDCSPVWCSVKE